MNSYSLLIFLHVTGAVGIFAAWGMEAALLQRLREAITVGEARSGIGALRRQGRLGPAAMLTVLVTGIWMMAVAWRGGAWMVTALAAVVVIGMTGSVLGGRAMSRLDAALAGEPDRLTDDFGPAVGLLTIGLRVRFAIGIGILGLMTIKPGVAGSLAIMGAALVAGLALAGRAAWRPALAINRTAHIGGGA
jgi:hypothetical protein